MDLSNECSVRIEGVKWDPGPPPRTPQMYLSSCHSGGGGWACEQSGGREEVKKTRRRERAWGPFGSQLQVVPVQGALGGRQP